MSDSSPLPNRVVIPFLPGQPLLYPVCQFHLERICEHPEDLNLIQWGTRDEMEAINEAVECETFSTAHIDHPGACALCAGQNHDLHAC